VRNLLEIPAGRNGQLAALLRPSLPRSWIRPRAAGGQGYFLPFPLPPAPSSAFAAFRRRSLIQLDRGRPSCSAAL
jgi:hypothetical protein